MSVRHLIHNAPAEGNFAFTDERGNEIDIYDYIKQHNIKLHKHKLQEVFDLGKRLFYLNEYYLNEYDERPWFTHKDFQLIAKLLDCVMKLNINFKKRLFICFYPEEECDGCDCDEHNKMFIHINYSILRATIDICGALLINSDWE